MKFELSFQGSPVIPVENAPEAAGYYATSDGGVTKYFLTYSANLYSWRRIFPRTAIVSEGTSTFPTMEVAFTAAYEENYTVFGFENESEVLK